MDWEFIIKYAPMYVRAARLTLRIGGLGILLSIVVGFACSFVRYRRIPVLHSIAGMYIELARNTPLLIQLFFLYFGLPKIGLKLSAEACAVVGLCFLGGAYMAESFRSGMEAVEKSQAEAGLCLGLTAWQADHRRLPLRSAEGGDLDLCRGFPSVFHRVPAHLHACGPAGKTLLVRRERYVREDT